MDENPALAARYSPTNFGFQMELDRRRAYPGPGKDTPTLLCKIMPRLYNGTKMPIHHAH